MRYNPALDSLRALSVVLILLFHAYPALMPSGFIGVDIFFVISGYLISRIIISEIASDQFRYAEFFKRRFVRIFPALLAMLAALMVAGWLLLPEIEYRELVKHTLTSLGFVQNFMLAKETGYFEASAEYRPLLHLWSLSIEEQFYIAWPFLLVYLAKRKIPATGLILQLAAGSFLLSLIYAEHGNFVFYSPLTRAWELGLGGLAVCLQRDHTSLITKINYFINKLCRNKNTFPLILFSILIFISILQNGSPTNSFILPAVTLLAFFFIIFATNTAHSDLNIPKPIVYVGRISYSLYLWHWPVLALFKTQGISAPATALLVSALLAIATHHCIEQPIRSSRRAIFLLATGFLGLSATSAWIIFFNSKTPLIPPSVSCQRYAEETCQSQNSLLYINESLCRENFTGSKTRCDPQNNSQASIAIIGDSHVLNYAPGLRKHYGPNVLALSHLSTLPFANTLSFEKEPTDSNGLLKYVIQTKSVHTVFLAGHWSRYYYNQSESPARFAKTLIQNVKDSENYQRLIQNKNYRPADNNQKNEFTDGLFQTLDLLNEAGKEVFILLDIPYQAAWRDCAAKPLNTYMKTQSKCVSPRDRFHSDQGAVNAAIRTIAANFKNTRVLDPSDLLCDEQGCHLYMNGIFMYSDSNHLSTEGADYLAPMMLKKLSIKL